MLTPGGAAPAAAARRSARANVITLQQLVQGYGIPLARISAFEELGIIDAAGADRYTCEDDDRLIIAAAAVQLGFTLRELRELMDLYDEASPARRALPNFMKLLASYQRLMAWRQPEGYDPPPAGRQRKPFRARLFRPEIVSAKEST